MMPDSTPDPHAGSRAKLSPLPITRVAVPSIHEGPQGIHLQRPGSLPRLCPLPPPPMQVLSISAWMRNVAATSLDPEVELLQYPRANTLESDTAE